MKELIHKLKNPQIEPNLQIVAHSDSSGEQ